MLRKRYGDDMKKGCASLLIGLFLPFALFFLLMMSSGGLPASYSNGLATSTTKLSAKVLAYQPVIERYAADNGISEYVPYLLAIMMVESRGEGSDPMQSSESLNGQIGTIKDPDSSIRQGVIHFKNTLQRAKATGSDVLAAVQAYNYGSGFIDFVNGQPWTFERALEFSKKQANGRRVVYRNEISKSKGYEYRYDYGNMFYVLLVQQYLIGGAVGSGQLKLPVPGYIVTSTWAEHRDLILQDGSRLVDIHNGIDFVYADNRVHGDIYSAGDGLVVFSGWSGGYGNVVVVQHEAQLYTYYAHLSKIGVKKDERVTVGQVVGLMGTTGASTGEHLHFGVSTELFSKYVDPTTFLGIENKKGVND